MIKSKKKLKVLAADFLNSLPLTIEVKEDDYFDFEYVLPSEGARRMMEEEADIALLPVAALAEIGGLEIVPGPCIAANGRVESVVIVSQVSIDKIERLYIDDASRTSVILAKIFLNSVDKPDIPFIRCNGFEIIENVNGNSAGLLIADLAFKESKKFIYRHDLAEVWKRLTGEPFVFAVWAAKKGVINQELIERINRCFWDGLARKHGIIEKWSVENNYDKLEVADYLDERIQYNLNKSAWYGLQEFFRISSNMKLLPDARIEFSISEKSFNSKNSFGKFIPEVIPFNKTFQIDRILSRAEAGRRISLYDAERLYEEASLLDLGEVAHKIRLQINPEPKVSYIVARNINYTNVCNVDCGFCNFYRSDNPQRKGFEEGYVLTKETIRGKMNELAAACGVQALVQGGVNPNLGLDYYVSLLKWMKSEWPQIQQNSFSADEVLGLCPNKSSKEIEYVLNVLRDSGLDTLPGAGAEILVDKVRRRVSYKKSRSSIWLDVMRQVGKIGMKASATQLYGMGENTRDKFVHLSKLRQLQDEVNPFMVFITWSYQKGNDQKMKAYNQASSTYLRMQAISRIFLDNFQHIMCSWVTQGPDVGQTALYYGADDFGSVMFEENVVSASGTTFRMDNSSMEYQISNAGFLPFRRKGDFSEWNVQEHNKLVSQSKIIELIPNSI